MFIYCSFWNTYNKYEENLKSTYSVNWIVHKLTGEVFAQSVVQNYTRAKVDDDLKSIGGQQCFILKTYVFGSWFWMKNGSKHFIVCIRKRRENRCSWNLNPEIFRPKCNLFVEFSLSRWNWWQDKEGSLEFSLWIVSILIYQEVPQSVNGSYQLETELYIN